LSELRVPPANGRTMTTTLDVLDSTLTSSLRM
jgi:hypothetical protein